MCNGCLTSGIVCHMVSSSHMGFRDASSPAVPALTNDNQKTKANCSSESMLSVFC